MRSNRAARSGGFTLLEMIIVLMVIGLATSLILVRGPLHSSALDLRVAAEMVAATLREGRTGATTTERAVVFTAFPTGQYGLNGHARPALPAGITIAAPARTIFYPDGSTSGGRVVLGSTAGRIAIAVDALTGHVTTRQITP
ncbi:prepilin-type N-terminal cleavage/methylation domain-containing protein [Komagataeibacter sp. FNDCR2]|uniref:prepilin-type N-terminal cleavage/methylation domain-containing protein n=1 Tax=Komagataeibacter sp. FNDCR2 TaxID=2878682 RepID=UPI001E5DE636|nr:prepilin-type N-terminal cleavage/methylation domain-containing protein [Komagataeibacter sp. FNDCR2]MCE2574225.1 prepilin-type N-terminal cleavage/methylation domain-containing protein [Komagataeibacter sp. FNDCR2]